MKILKAVLPLLVLFLWISSCQKELSFDGSGASIGTFKKDGNGNCLPITVNGIYKADSTLTIDNFVDVQVMVTNPGTFNISSDTINGYSFSKTGSLVNGLNTIRLYAKGKPTLVETNTFTLTYGNSQCSFIVTVIGSNTGTAVFTLGSALGVCTGASVAGIYKAGTTLDASNTLTVQVNVTTIGTYILGGVTTNGFAFGATGVFTITGLQNVTLNGTGTPTAAAISPVIVSNIASTCTFPITVLPAGGGGGTPAVFTLDGSPNTCAAPTINGTYTQGISMAATNTVSIKVNVTTIGTYNITTTAINGVTFALAGTFTVTGAQTVLLKGTGTPTAAGLFNFTPNTGNNSCSFPITFLVGTAPPLGDYFPLTQNSWWSYTYAVQGIPETDTLYNVIKGTGTYGGNAHTNIQQNINQNPYDTFHYRKVSNDYFQWALTDHFSAQFAFDNPIFGNILFLKENAATGTSWTSSTFTGVVGGVSASLKYNFKIENANTSLTINGKSYTNVIYVSVVPQVSLFGAPFTTIENNEFYFAKGIGLIKEKYKDATTGTVLLESGIKNYMVF